ncbi:MAG TPA: plastocyanin/azurin family copper-binding protein [Acidimicrobiales bacterium]|nr:plastocyanin/azurin family copper-binding protein [Acidimicrobiales bacterium]
MSPVLRAGAVAAVAALVLVGVGPGAVAARAGSGAGRSGGGEPGARTVVLTIHHSRFSTDTLPVAPGTTVRFILRNQDPIAHELIVGDAMVQLVHERGSEAHHSARPGEVSVAPGEEAETTYTFGAPGRLMFGCHLPGHWAYGMHGAIEVA